MAERFAVAHCSVPTAVAGLANGLMAMRVHVVAAAWVACGVAKREHVKASWRELAWRVSVRVPCEDGLAAIDSCACAAGRPRLGLVRVGHRSSHRNLGGQRGRRSSAARSAISRLLQDPPSCDGLALADRHAQPPRSCCLMRYSLPPEPNGRACSNHIEPSACVCSMRMPRTPVRGRSAPPVCPLSSRLWTRAYCRRVVPFCAQVGKHRHEY